VGSLAGSQIIPGRQNGQESGFRKGETELGGGTVLTFGALKMKGERTMLELGPRLQQMRIAAPGECAVH
jgi:hypothetical protein